MIFLCEVHIPYKLVNFLRSKNCSAFHINDIFSDSNISDSVICNYADMNDCIVITKDSDFKKTYLLKRTPKKLIKLNVGKSSTGQIIDLFKNNWNLLEQISNKSFFYIESDTENFYLIDTKK